MYTAHTVILGASNKTDIDTDLELYILHKYRLSFFCSLLSNERMNWNSETIRKSFFHEIYPTRYRVQLSHRSVARQVVSG